MESSPRSATPRPGHRLLQKLTHRHKRENRQPQSLDEVVNDVNVNVTLVEHGHTLRAVASKDSLTGTLLFPIPPTYTPMPIPDRTSSAKRADSECADSANGSTPKQSQPDLSLQQEQRDDVSLDFSEFNNGILPTSPVSRAQSATPDRARSRMHVRESSANDDVPASPASVLSQVMQIPATLTEETLAQLQTPSPDQSNIQNTELISVHEDSWDVIKPSEEVEALNAQLYSLERRAEQLYSAGHLQIILEDPKLLSKFSSILQKCRPWRVAVLSYYLAACKAKRALEYANSLSRELALMPYDQGIHPAGIATNSHLEAAAQEAFDALLKDDLHYYITHTWIRSVSAIVQRRITGTLPPRLYETSNGLAEVFCITDPSLTDNPIILASEAFTRHSGCSLEYVLGRNCRFMQGPGTTVDSVRRFRASIQEVRDHNEILVNYRRDGSPFLSLVMNAPLLDSDGKVRYFLGAQVDVSGLLKNCNGMEGLSRLVEDEASNSSDTLHELAPERHQELKALSDMFDPPELEIVRKTGGSLRRSLEHIYEPSTPKTTPLKRLVLDDTDTDQSDESNEIRIARTNSSSATSAPVLKEVDIQGNLSGVYKYYLLIRPHPSLRILFTSPTLRSPGILQSPFLDRIGGSQRMRNDLQTALKHRKNVTAKIRWLSEPSENGEGEGKTRWIHCTPLIHYSGQVALWMVVLVPPLQDVVGGSGSGRSQSRGKVRVEQ